MRTLLVASGGGHLTQLHLLRARLRPHVHDPLWVTYDIPQARSLLAGEDVVWGHHPTTRSVRNAVRNYRLARRLFAEHEIDRVVSTGAALAVPFLVRARQLDIPGHYIESATRVGDPSLSGRILEWVPGVQLYTQYPHWLRRRWYHPGSVFDGFHRTDAPTVPGPIRSIFVTLGTQSYPFDALVERVLSLVTADERVTWQLGATLPPSGLPGEVHAQLDADQQRRLLATSDVVIGHCGTGLALSSLEAGKAPVLVPRRARRGEHIDDHQTITAKELRERDLALVREVELLTRDDLEQAARATVTRTDAEPFPLAEGDDPQGALAPLDTPARRRAQLGRRLALADAVVIGLSSLLAYAARNALGQAGVVRELANEIPAALGVLPLWLMLLYLAGAYKREYLNSGGDAFRRFAAGSVMGVLALGFMSFLLELRLARLYVLFLFLLVFVLGGLLRVGVRAYLARQQEEGRLLQRVLLVGTDQEAREAASSLARSTHSGYRLIGFLDPDQPLGTPVEQGLTVLGTPDQVLEVAYRHRAGLVLVAPSAVPPGTLKDLRLRLEGSPIDLAVAPSLTEVLSRRVTIENVANMPVFHIDQIRLGTASAMLKRTVDIVVSILLAIVSLPVAAAAALAVRLEDRGPALFRQQRVGKDGAPFTIYKFRTMVPDAEARLQEIEHLNEAGHAFFKVRRDPRITRVGAFLRKWSIDELPQLWNVLRGDMSMVGPRPPLPSEVEDYQPWQLRRLRVRPGITGVWQVSGRSNVPFEEAVRLDLFYIENWSLGYDLFLLGKTVLAVLGGRGAY